MSLALAAPSAASVDRLRAADAPLALKVAGVAGFALLTAALAQFELRIYLWEVPLTLQSLAVYGSGLFLGWRLGVLSMALYLALGLVFPFYAGGGTGVEHLLGASVGYLFAFPLVALAAGTITRSDRSAGRVVLGILAGSAVLFACGVVGLHGVVGLDWGQAVMSGWVKFLPWDLTKIALVASVYLGARRATS